MDWTTIIVAALTGSVSGLAASIIAPWANWGVERHRLRHTARVQLIKDARELLRQNGPQGFASTHEYSRLRSKLDKKLVTSLEQGRTIIVGPDGREGGNAFMAQLLDEIARIESEWKLL